MLPKPQIRHSTVLSCRRWFCCSHSLTFRTLRPSICCCKRLLLYARFETSIFIEPYCLELQLCFHGRCDCFTAYPQVKSYNLCIKLSLFYGGSKSRQDVWDTLHSTSGQSLSFRVALPLYICIHELLPLTCKCTNERVMGRLVSACSCLSIYSYFVSV